MTVFPMFPIIPHHLSTRSPYSSPACSSTSRTPTQETRKKPQVSVVAAIDLPAFVSTAPIPLDTIIHAKLNNTKYELEVNEAGQLVCSSEESCASWLRHCRISLDCHSVHLVVRRIHTAAAVVVQTVREVTAGQHLSLWFDEDALAVAHVPFLTPINIQGEKNYICHQCRKRFEYPNPLKIHLSLDCGKMRRVELWKKLLGTILPEKKSNESILSLDGVYNMKLKAFSFLDFSKSLNTSPSSSPDQNRSLTASNPIKLDSPRSNEELDRPSSEPAASRFSAFKPYLSFETSKMNHSDNESISSTKSIPQNLIFPGPQFVTQNPLKLSTLDFNEKIHNQTHYMDQQAMEMETIVSNLGRSKQGHLCVYCGKVYSRKYGLKIHIRTHTGFKPLKCKFCFRPFGDPSNLNKHVRLHSEGETPYKCEECGKVLVRRRDLERHMKSRHQQEDCN